MSYIVLARKYRPRSFAEMVGQSHVVQALGNALTQQRLHHAYLFTGTRGVGKTTVSRILAKSLNCTGADGQGGITATPCGVCNACRDIDAGRYVDYVELDAASNRGVDEISQLLDQSVYKPVLGRFKVYMIDEVHMLSTTAFNAMLKTLEEPPEYLKFVLATTDPQKVPVTVLSRCLQFNLRPMAGETVFEHLQSVLTAEAVPYEDAALRLLARGARGSMRDALSLTDQAIAFAGGSLGEAAVRQMLGAVDRGHVVRIVEALAASDGVALVRTVDELRALGLSAAGTLEELAHLAQQLAVLQAVPQAIDATQPDAAQLQALVPLLAADEIQLLYSIALHGRAELALAPDEYSGLVMVLLRMLAFRPMGVAKSAAAPAGGRSTEAPTAARSAPLLAERASAAAVGVPAAAGAAIAHAASRPVLPAAAPSPTPHAFTVPSAPAAAAPPVPTAPSASRELLRSGSAASATLVPPTRLAPPAPMPARASASVSEQPLVNRQQAAEPSPSLLRAAPAAAPAAAPTATAQSAESAPWDDEPPWVRDEAATAPASPLAEPAAQAWVAVPVPSAVSDVADAATAAIVATMPVTVADASAMAIEPAAATMASVVAPEFHAAANPAQDRWVEVVQQLFAQGGVAGLVRSLAWQAECIAIDDPADPARWTLRVARESLRQSSHCERLQAALTELFGRPQHLEIVPGEALDSAALRDATAKAQAQSDAEQVITHDPLVLQLLASYPGARIVPGSIRPR